MRRNLPLVLVGFAISHRVPVVEGAFAVLLVLIELGRELAIKLIHLHAEDAIVRDWLRHLRRRDMAVLLEEGEKSLVLLDLLDLCLLRKLNELRHARPLNRLHLATIVILEVSQLLLNVTHMRRGGWTAVSEVLAL